LHDTRELKCVEGAKHLYDNITHVKTIKSNNFLLKNNDDLLKSYSIYYKSLVNQYF